jgi:putative holliday junction resolvase
MQATRSTILALDVGTKRTGVAASDVAVRLARPLTTLTMDENIQQALQALVHEHGVIGLVVGLPRGLDGQETAQTGIVRAFVEALKPHLQLPYYWQDEAVTSLQAEEELQRRGKPYKKGDIDALSATYILEDFLRDHPEVVA